MEIQSETTHSRKTEILHTPEILSPSSSNSGDEVMESVSGPPPITLINEKNYITLTEGSPANLTADELSEVVEQCKDLVLKTSECSEERRWLVRRLIELRFQLQDAKDNEVQPCEEATETKVVLGHHFKMEASQLLTTAKVICDECCALIMTVVQSWYECVDCQFKCHIKCLTRCCRVCPHLMASETSKFEERICPEIGLDAQGYACAECKTPICFSSQKDSSLAHQLSVLRECVLPIQNRRIRGQQPRRCDYSGLYFCSSCHWNNTEVIPARVSQHWDFEPRPVSRAAYQLLQLTQTRPIMQINPQIEGFVEDIYEVKKLREDLMMMKQYLIRCRNATKEQLPWHLVGNRQYFLTDCDYYSIRDLIELKNKELHVKLRDIRSEFEKHIKTECKICSGQGYICEICKDKKVVFPFDSTAYNCLRCHWVYHKICYQSVQKCTRCVRIEQRKSRDAEEDEVLLDEFVEKSQDSIES